MVFQLSLPNDANNEYSKLFAKIIWKFSYESEKVQSKDEDNTPNNEKNPQTGDFDIDWSITVFLLSTLGFIVTIALDKINKERSIEERN